MTSIWWIRRDLRLRDNPALAAAADEGTVLPLFVRDDRLSAVGRPRRARLEASLAALDESLGGALVVRTGDPARIVAAVAAEAKADSVHLAREFTPFGLRRDRAVSASLATSGVRAVASGSAYVVDPGTVLTGQGTPYQVFTPFAKAWRGHAVAEVPEPADVQWDRSVEGEQLDPDLLEAGRDLGAAGEQAALDQWHHFLDGPVDCYDEHRDRPDLAGTSHLSAHLHFGEIHPRTLLADLAETAGESPDVDRFVTELAWREFYADVLWHRPDSAWGDLRPELAAMSYDSGPGTDALVDAWREGRTGFPFVDAGMRQLIQTGWMHNRLRMVTASFLVKDLHVWWPVGARHFLDHLIDGDVASNNHGWQWVAGTGTDASPYFRVFNPVAQAKRFDPDGAYVRRWVPELAHLHGASAHEPWRHTDGYLHGYPEPIVDHGEERRESLDRYDRARGRR